MGTTMRMGKLPKGEVRRGIDSYNNTSLFDHMLFNGKSVGDYKKNRQYQRDRYAQRKNSQEQAAKPKPLLDTNLTQGKTADMVKRAPKQASFVDNNGNLTYAGVKQATLTKLALLRLAIDYVLRNRYSN